MKTVALIPARGGSKGVPGKNIAPVLGKPLIVYSIEVALACKGLHSIWVSSDSEEILAIARTYKTVNIHKRQKALATDNCPITQTIEQIFELTPNSDALVLLQPTSPLRNTGQIEEAVRLLENHPEANSVISVCVMKDIHPARMYWMENTGGSLQSILPTHETTRRQDIPPAYYRNGSIYVVRRKAFEQTGQIMAAPSIGYVMPATQLLNIDEPRDLLIAETLMKAWLQGEL